MSPSQTRALFSSLSAELAAMMETVDGLTAIVTEHARLTPPDRRSDVLVKAQGIDDLHQTLDSLRVLSAALSGGVPIDEALADVRLAALAQRLQSAVTATHGRPAPAARSGDFVMFE
ncbi:MAG: hypothetical protein KKG14_14845 [Alphaproteobacteria bacterium]|nr:hypothetical protein [Alphaproteobacteria bacterium]MBU2269824.1 hypothetical protein [Alphaproteobacteria bacterium]MBU2419976.1 hypothetical protein [Alphaproteobacteria bacterium]